MPKVVLTSYRALLPDSKWFLTLSWSMVVLVDTHNVISAGSLVQIQTLANLNCLHKVLICSRPLKEKPIDLWNTIHLMFPSIIHKKVDIDREGTQEYKESVDRLHNILSGLLLSRSRTSHLVRYIIIIS